MQQLQGKHFKENKMENRIMINEGLFEVGTYGKYTHKGEILHMCDSYAYGNSEEEVREILMKHLKGK